MVHVECAPRTIPESVSRIRRLACPLAAQVCVLRSVRACLEIRHKR